MKNLIPSFNDFLNESNILDKADFIITRKGNLMLITPNNKKAKSYLKSEMDEEILTVPIRLYDIIVNELKGNGFTLMFKVTRNNKTKVKIL